MKLKLIATGIIGALTISVASAGDPAPPIEVDNSLGATLSAGYMSDYIFYGGDLGDHGIHTGIDYTIDVLPVAIDIGAWYINTVDPSEFDELDLYAGIGLPSFAGFESTLTFLTYLAPQDAFDTQYELNLGIEKSLGFVDANLMALYDFELEAWYFETGVSKGISVTDNIEVVVSTGIAYSIDYWSNGSNWNHVYVQADLPIALTDTATLTPYVAGLWSLDALDDFQGDQIHGGVSLSVSF